VIHARYFDCGTNLWVNGTLFGFAMQREQWQEMRVTMSETFVHDVLNKMDQLELRGGVEPS
jgi:hypothetical protein